MPESWDQLRSLNNNRQLCADEIQEIRSSCQKVHSKSAILECPECYVLALERMKTRYLERPDEAWFSGRHGFVQDLSARFSAAKRDKTGLGKIEAFIQDEKRRWYYENVSAAVFRLALEDSPAQEALLGRLSNGLQRFDGLVERVRRALNKNGRAATPDDVDSLLRRLCSAQEPDYRLDACKDAFFPGAGVGADSRQKYLAMLQDGLSMSQVVERILDDRQAALASRDLIDERKRELEVLRRARAAHELQKTKRTKGLAPPRMPAELYDLPACITCGRAPDATDFFSCSLCQVLAGLRVREKATVYCSRQCFDRGQVRRVLHLSFLFNIFYFTLVAASDETLTRWRYRNFTVGTHIRARRGTAVFACATRTLSWWTAMPGARFCAENASRALRRRRSSARRNAPSPTSNGIAKSFIFRHAHPEAWR
jgi:hypothetical protein